MSYKENLPVESQLVLEPSLDPQTLLEAFGKHRFQRPASTMHAMEELSKEDVSILSDEKCRYFLAQIAPELLQQIGKTPAPDATLENLVQASRSIGGKGILWELFQVHKPSMDLYVRLCGASPYLLSILINNPGMIDELLDSLMLSHLPTLEQLESLVNDLCRGSSDLLQILYAFKIAMHLNVGVRDVLGKDSIGETHRALTDIADVCLHRIVDKAFDGLLAKHGAPMGSHGSVSPFTILTFGKYGGREPNYHSDMTLLCVYGSEGKTEALPGAAHRITPLNNSEFFHLLAQRVGQDLNKAGKNGRLYEAKFWNITNGPHAPLAWNLEVLRDYFLKHPMTWSQKLALCKGRVVYGSPTFGIHVHSILQSVMTQHRWQVIDEVQMKEGRAALESTASEQNIKRGVGGTLDIEWLAQALTQRNSLSVAQWEPPSTFNLLSRLSEYRIISPEDAKQLRENYDFLRRVESGLRLMNTSARHDIPIDALDRNRLAYVLNLPSSSELIDRIEQCRRSNRELFEKYLGAE